MNKAPQEAPSPERRSHECPSCRRQTPHEVKLRRRGTEALACTVCGLVSLVSAAKDAAPRADGQG